jgi:uncharacterized protein (TIGR02646 family)
MKFIPKNPEPASFTHWKQQASADWQPSFGDLRHPERPEVINSLLIEQGYICCYCCQRLSPTRSHIEHLKPQKHCLEAEKIAYENLLASCNGSVEEEIAAERLPKEFCGHKKGDWYDPNMMVSPLDPHCAEYFSYAVTGKILPTTNVNKRTAAETTIERLGLNHSKLKRGRQRVIGQILLTTESSTEQEIRQFIQSLNQPDDTGKLSQFCTAAIFQLQQFLPTELT